ncbi:hypothetical protein HUU62_25905 [Rhodoferax sp. 4810]|nr:hypothetical protein [Rhodoferax jenense]
MKKLTVTINLEMSVPDNWALTETSEGTQVLALPHGQFLDLTVEPLFTDNPEATWASTDDEGELHTVLDMVESEEVHYAFVNH